jgi:GH15 family glucan-1,4-alpha-glucosidase
MSATPIAEHALLSDRHSCALVDKAGSVEWLCFPRFDSPSVFGRLLDDAAGHWSIRPDGRYDVSRRYLDRTMVLETTFRTGAGSVVLVDALAAGADNQGHLLGPGAPHLLIREVACTAGRVDLELQYVPRPEHGHVMPLLSAVDGGVTARGGADCLVLSAPVRLDVGRSSARARVRMRAGEVLWFALHRSTSEEHRAHVWSQAQLADRLTTTAQAWRSWSDLHQRYRGPWADVVHHSGRVLQALSFQPSGAIVAAATTSLPEGVGAEPNRDHRYSWLRGAGITTEALWVAACPDEAADFVSFTTTASATSAAPDHALQTVFGVGGEHDLSQRVLPRLSGWRGSRPVRVGVDVSQHEPGVHGELLSAAHRLADHIHGVDDDTKAFLVSIADEAAIRWRETDRGIWHAGGVPRLFVHSKVMHWVALDRAVALAPVLDAENRAAQWKRAQDEIFATVMRHGWNEAQHTFTQSFGSDALDASGLVIPIVGFLPPDDPHVLATIDAVEERLTDEHGLVHRYRTEEAVDGGAGRDGAVLLWTFTLARALALAGRVDRARAVFERAVGRANDVGLLAGDVDPRTGEMLGNFPQALSHVGLVNAAWTIGDAERRIAEQHGHAEHAANGVHVD